MPDRPDALEAAAQTTDSYQIRGREMKVYEIRCLQGAATTILVRSVWARDLVEAFDRCRADGYIPIGLAK